MTHIYEYRIPSWALSVIFNGDESGLDDVEIENVNNFVNKVQDDCGSGHWSWDSEDESFFCRDNDVDNLAGDCVDVLYIVIDHNPLLD